MRWKRGTSQDGTRSDYYIESDEGYRVCVRWVLGVKWYEVWAPKKNQVSERLP